MNGLKLTTADAKARPVAYRLEQLIEALNLDCQGVSLSVSSRNRFPECVGSFIRLPLIKECGGWEQFAKSFLHELSHAQDFLAGSDLGYEEAEKKARLAEKRLAEAPNHLQR